MNDELREQALAQIRMTFPMLFSEPTAAHRNSFALKSVNMKSDESTGDIVFTLVRDDDEKVDVPAESFASVQEFKRSFLSFGIMPALTGYQASELFAHLHQYCVAFGVAEVTDTVADYCASLFNDYWNSPIVSRDDDYMPDNKETQSISTLTEALVAINNRTYPVQSVLFAGIYYFKLERLGNWQRASGRDPLNQKQLTSLLRVWGAKPGNTGTFRYWMTPAGFVVGG